MLAQTADERPGSLALGALVFGAGIGALATEITASRLLAPYFGSSTIVWANLIRIVLAALALGYWLGGRVADGRPLPSLLGSIVLAAAVCVAAIPFVAKPFLDLTVEGLDSASAGAVIGASSPSCCSARLRWCCWDGLAVRHSSRCLVHRDGRDKNRGTSLCALDRRLAPRHVPACARPHPGRGNAEDIRRHRGAARRFILFLLGARYLVVAVALAALVAVPPGAVKPEAGLLHEETSYYQYIQVVERSDGERLLSLNEGVAVRSIWRPDSVLTGGVWDAFLAIPPLLDRPLERVAILGKRGQHDRALSASTTRRRRSTASSSIQR